MDVKRISFAGLAALGMMALTLRACGGSQATSARLTPKSLPPAVFLPSDLAVTEQTIRFLENRIKRDPEDFIAHNKLASYYLQRVRETGDLTYLKLASHASRASLCTMPAERNVGGLTVLAQAEFTSHEFVASRDHAKRLTELEPDKSYPQLMLGDALFEL